MDVVLLLMALPASSSSLIMTLCLPYFSYNIVPLSKEREHAHDSTINH